MSTILEVLQNANFNLNEQPKNIASFTDPLGKEQLKNAVILLDKGYLLEDDFDEILGENDTIEEVPDKNNND